MSFLRTERYYCANTEGSCHYAVNDVPFSAEEVRRAAGRCRGKTPDGCGETLVRGESRDLRLIFAVACVVFAGLALGLRWYWINYVNPPPLEHVAFAISEVRVEDTDGQVHLEVIRDGNRHNRAEVTYASRDGSAKAGQDYEATQSRLVFEPGEASKSIAVMVLPDLTQQKESRYFSLALLNVLGAPTLVVRIVPHPVDRAVELQAEQTVLSASRIAADIGDDMTRHDVLLDLLTRREVPPSRVERTRKTLDEVQGNLNRAREAYSQILHELLTFETPLVMRTIDRVTKDLITKQAVQQAHALSFVKEHLGELIQKKSPDMDRWARQLRTIVPPVSPAERPPTNTAGAAAST